MDLAADPGGAAALLGIGAVAGLASALLGIGGGLVMVPLLHYGLGQPFPDATATSLVAMAVQVPVGIHAHARRGAVRWPLAWPLVAGGAVGVLAGILLQPRTPVPWLKLLFAAVLVVAAWRMVAKPPAPRATLGAPAVAGIGAVAGLASRLLGIGGGLVTVPLLTLGGTPVHVAVGTSLVAVFTNAALAAAVALALGTALLPPLVLAVAGAATSPAGAWLAHRMDATHLRQVFAGALVVAAAWIGLTAW